nr:hypothetical protein [Candidatus Sigynarchaeota archaeon]
MGIDYELIICMDEGYVPTLQSVEAIVRLFEKHKLKPPGYPPPEACKQLRNDPNVASLVDSIKKHKRNRDLADGHDHLMSRLAVTIERYHIVDRETWTILNTVDWDDSEACVEAPDLIDCNIFRNNLFKILINAFGPVEIGQKLLTYFKALEVDGGDIGEAEKKMFENELDVDAELERIASERLWNAFPIQLPSWGKILNSPYISMKNCISYGDPSDGRSTRFMIREEFFEHNPIESFIEYFKKRYTILFKEIKEMIGSELVVMECTSF